MLCEIFFHLIMTISLLFYGAGAMGEFVVKYWNHLELPDMMIS